VLCVDDHAFLVEGLQSRLSMEGDIEIAGWLATASDLLDEVERTAVDIVLMDIDMPGTDPFEVIQDLARSRSDVRVIMLSAFVRDHYVDQALKAGAWGYVSKSDDPEAVIDAIRKVMRSEFAFSPIVIERCQPSKDGTPRTDRPRTKLDLLTPREIQILRMIAKGMSRVDIAESLHRSPKTVDNHRAAIMEKLGISDRVELARYAISEGLVEL
jgi:DNA-binding NarL/FixJ family response regulator